MVREYRGAAGCNFSTQHRHVFRNHLQRKTWCQCKDCGWTIEQACAGVDGRSSEARAAHASQAAPVTGDANSVHTANHSHNNSNNNNTIHIHVNGPILASGSDAERAYLQEHAEGIIKSILAGTTGPEADILARFVNETWCSAKHESLNNVCSLEHKGHAYIVLQMRGGEPHVDTIAGREAPQQLTKMAQRIMHQFAVDTAGGYDPMKFQPKQDSFKPTDETNRIAFVDDELLSRKKERQRVGAVICTQLRKTDKRVDKRRKIEASAQ